MIRLRNKRLASFGGLLGAPINLYVTFSNQRDYVIFDCLYKGGGAGLGGDSSVYVDFLPKL